MKNGLGPGAVRELEEQAAIVLATVAGGAIKVSRRIHCERTGVAGSLEIVDHRPAERRTGVREFKHDALLILSTVKGGAEQRGSFIPRRAGRLAGIGQP